MAEHKNNREPACSAGRRTLLAQLPSQGLPTGQRSAWGHQGRRYEALSNSAPTLSASQEQQGEYSVDTRPGDDATRVSGPYRSYVEWPSAESEQGQAAYLDGLCGSRH